MIGYKLFRVRDDGTLGSLFINRDAVIPLGVNLQAGCHPRKGFAVRKGWHGTLEPVAPHLCLTPKNGEKRAWYKVKFTDFKLFDRPAAQGGTWVLAQRMTVKGAL